MRFSLIGFCLASLTVTNAIVVNPVSEDQLLVQTDVDAEGEALAHNHSHQCPEGCTPCQSPGLPPCAGKPGPHVHYHVGGPPPKGGKKAAGKASDDGISKKEHKKKVRQAVKNAKLETKLKLMKDKKEKSKKDAKGKAAGAAAKPGAAAPARK